MFGDSPTCLNDQYDIKGSNATLQGFGRVFGTELLPEHLLETVVKIISNENCTALLENLTGLDKDRANFALPNGVNEPKLCTIGYKVKVSIDSIKVNRYDVQKVTIKHI